jgi:hypothetical protein
MMLEQIASLYYYLTKITFEGTILMPQVRRPIDPADFTVIPRWREIIKTLPKEIRVCQRHDGEVTIQECDFSSNPGGSAPFGRADWVGCCDEAIDRVIEGVRMTLEQIDQAKQTYNDELARKLEPDHTGEIVAIELGTNDYFVGEDEVEAADKARAAGHEGSLFFLRVGSPYAHRVMTPRQ